MEDEGRETATPEEQETLAVFTGWGQFPGLFNSQDYNWQTEREQLKSVLSDSEFKSAKESSGDKDEPTWKAAKRATLNSHFTAPEVVDAHWKAAQKLGFTGGRYLEPSIGSGYYLGMMPEELAKTTSVTGVETDTTTAQIAQKLYPSASIRNQGFEELQAPDGFFDLAASNVPFGDYTIHEKRYNRFNAPIHDHFFLKSIDKVRPGGLVMHVTSAGTLDKGNDRIRKEMAGKADFIAAIRMPSGTHGKSANTQVVTDLIILRKHTAAGPAPELTPDDLIPEPGFTGVLTDSLGRVYHFVDGKRVPGDQWTQTTTVPDPAGGEPIPINQYFANNPDQVLGTTDRTGMMYGGNQPNVTAGEDFNGDLDAAIERLPSGIYDSEDVRSGAPDLAPDGDIKNNTLSVRDGKIVQYRDGVYHPMNAPQAHVERVAAADDIRQSMRALIAQDLSGADSSDARSELNDHYDAFVATHGFLHETGNIRALSDDPDLPLLLSLEKYNRKAKTAEKADIFTENTIRPERGITSADDVPSGLGVSLNERGRVDVEHIGELTGKAASGVEAELRHSGIAFEDPEHGWQSRAEYLSGNVRDKLTIAKEAAEHDERFATNVTALEAHQPEDIDYDLIGSKLGSPWVPAGDMGAFAASLLNGIPEDFSIRYVEQTGEWVAEYARGGGGLGSRLADGVAAGAWGTKAKPFMSLLDSALNPGKSHVVYKDGADGKREIDSEATEDARGKIQDMRDEFREWLWDDDERRKRLHRYYNDTINNIRPMEYDGSHLSYPGMNPDWTMRDVANDFVWQVITRGKGVLAHEVGIGKTSTMVAAAMELRRLGLAKKPAIVVPKATLEQMTADAQELYPGARILSTTGMFDAKKRKETVSKIATGDYDMVIMSHDNLDMLPMSSEVQERFIQDEIDELDAVAGQAEATDKGQRSRAVKALEKRKANLEAKLKKAIDGRKDDQITFEETGIDQIFVDEAHEYKNLSINTAMKGLGIVARAADKATNMLMRTRWLQEQNNGRGVVMATGTPISNSIAEMFNIQRYVQPDELEARGLTTFDSWANTFGDFETKQEPNLQGEYKPKTRFSRFTNIPELMQIARQDLDVRRVDALPPKILPDGSETAAVPRPNRRDHMELTPATDAVREMMADIRTRAAAVAGKPSKKGEDNTLNILTDGRQGAVDVRLYDPNAEDHPDSKVNWMIRNVLERYHDENAAGQTQLIFSDIGVHPKKDSGFHLYGDIIEKLVAGGIPRDEIANFGALDGEPRLEAAGKLRTGKVRIGIGGTKKLGTGLNVQSNLAAMHHIDVPYKPSEFEQRNGRGHRHGNSNDNVHIHNYVLESPLDEMSYGIVTRKDAFTKQAITDPKGGIREVIEEDVESLTPQQLMAAASGDNRIFERVNLTDRVKTLRRAEARHARNQSSLAKRIETATKTVSGLGSQAEQISRDSSDASTDFHATIDGQGSTVRADITGHLERAAERVDKQADLAKKNYRSTRSEHIGDVRGMKLHRHDGTYTLEGASGQKYVTGDSLQSMENVIRNLPKRAQKARDTIAQARTDVESIKGQIGRPFSKAAELATAQDELAALETDIRGGSKSPATEQPAEPEKYSRLGSAILERLELSIGVDRYAAKFDEDKHPRDDAGKFTDAADPIRLWRAAEDDYINADSTSFAESREAAEAYLDNPGFGGHVMHYTDVAPVDVLDLTTSGDPMAALLDTIDSEHDYGSIGVDELVPHIADRLADAGVQWVKVPESYPENTTTWVYVGGGLGDEPEMVPHGDKPEKYSLRAAILHRMELSIGVDRYAAKWDESKHKRATDGRFGDKAGDHAKKESSLAKHIEATGHVRPSSIEPVNPVIDEDKFDSLVSAFRSSLDEYGSLAWKGRPLLVRASGDGWAAITGSHRIHAAETVGTSETTVPVVQLDHDTLDLEIDGQPLWERLDDAQDDEDKVSILREYAEAYPEVTDAADLMAQEVAINEQDIAATGHTSDTHQGPKDTWAAPKQQITSEDTSINASKLPAMFNKVKLQPGTVNVDIGGGRFNNVAEHLSERGVESLVFDPFNRSAEHNEQVAQRVRDGQADTASVANVLNVIREPENRATVIQQAANAVGPDGVAYFQIYEGNGTGQGKETSKGWQQNRKTADYISEIGEVFGDVKRRGNIIEARTPSSPAASLKASITQKLKDYAEKGTRAPAFKAWFGDWERDPANASKVTSRNGKPLVVYHGSDDEIVQYEPGKKGHWYSFAPEEWHAEEFGSNVIATYLAIRNPLDLTHFGTGQDEWDEDEEEDPRADPKEIEVYLKSHGINVSLGTRKSFTTEIINRAAESIRAQSIQNGFDGLKMLDYISGDAVEYVAFDPNQIKSVDNAGTFDPSDDRMRYARRHKPAPGQGSFSWKEDDHPRAADGRFGDKSGDTPAKSTGVSDIDVGHKDEHPAARGETPVFSTNDRGTLLDETGKPLIVYHGTNREFDKFDPARGDEFGIYTSPRKKYAQNYGGTLRSSHVAMKNPLFVEGKYEISPRDLTAADVGALKDQGYDGIVVLHYEDPEKKAGPSAISQANEIVVFDGAQMRNDDVTAPVPQATADGIKATVAKRLAEEYAQHGTKSTAFKEWFGDWEKDAGGSSKVVVWQQENRGTPLVVYHGTDRKFNTFDTKRIGESHGDNSAYLGIFFSEDKGVAESYGDRDVGPVAAYLDIKNPYYMPWEEFERFEMNDDTASEAVKLREELQSHGYDGIQIEDTPDWIAFEPTQIKATDNAGTFDPSDDRMKYSRLRAEVGRKLANKWAEYVERYSRRNVR